MNEKAKIVENEIKEFYAKWCKDTKRNGGVLIGGSIKELLTSFAYELKEVNCNTVSEDIEAAAEKYSYEMQYANKPYSDDIKESFKAGVEWYKLNKML